ncbi:hypothetical protein PV325_006630 [Microctonus aethiopoides]|uniref:Coiled-coil domain-containing protein 43 n=1 Tax=Microctonus aethiopoides TaxID=144406 RepID=A0AA39EZV3_9HYME|nr:hypothetical protein PV325_006630 [Microctonus aethiopoides]KAK0080614.1 hypothetical protein PV326_008091 [Microctonus aethiopoides]KAK0160334.1 hypothetical protein PV328_007758 [Microctonus aethiopoides]
MAIPKDSFDSWLSKKLQALNTDESIFSSYIKGILEGDETEDEKSEILMSTLSSITEVNISENVSEILDAWAKQHPSDEIITLAGPSEDVDVRLARMLESQNLPTIAHRNYTDDERRIRETILAQYSQMSVDEKSDVEDEATIDIEATCGIERNTNVALILQQQKEKRERAKLESQKKKEKDKEDREKQKHLKEEKKEKRKSQKGERRR